MSVNIVLAFGIAISLVSFPGISSAQAPAALDGLFDAYQKPGSPAIAAAVVQNGKIAYQGAFGRADIANAVPATANTAFEIGSVSKMFTAFMVERLIHDGRLSADEDVRKFIPELPRYEAVITVRNLLQHTSGVRDYFELFAMRGFRFDDSTTQNEVVRLIERQKEVNFEPGSDYGYSNSEYVLLASIVEKVTGRPFATEAKETIFTPLGMSSALFLSDRTTLIPNKAQSYIPIGKRVISLAFNSDVNGPSGAWMSARDLGKWLAFLDRLAANEDPGFTAMSSRVRLPDGRLLSSGEGIFHGVHRGYAELFHDGGDSGYRSVAMLFPTQHLGVALLANSPAEDLVKLAERVADHYLPRHAGPTPAIEAAHGVVPVSNDSAVSPNLAGVQGVYRSEELDTSYTLRVEGTRLFADHIRNEPVQLTPTGVDTWTGDNWWCKSIVIERSPDGTVGGLRMRGFRGRKGVLFQRISQARPAENVPG